MKSTSATVQSMANWVLSVNKDLVVDNFTYEMQGDETWDSVTVQNAGKITHAIGATTNAGAEGVVLTADAIDIKAGAYIDVSGKGRLPNAEVTNGGSGSYGGLAALLSGSTTNAVFGEERTPMHFGVGGRNKNLPDGDQYNVRGGGAIKLVSDQLIVDGYLKADGSRYASYTEGAGSGGSIWINTGLLSTSRISKDSRISANGGNGNVKPGGGGGRIAVFYDSLTGITNDGYVAALGGNGGSGAGTVYWELKESAPFVIDTNLPSVSNAEVSSIEIRFNVAIDTLTFDVSDLSLRDELSNPIPITSLNSIASNRYELVLSEPLAEGNYQLTVGPDLFAANGRGMDQDKDGIELEIDQDVFIQNFAIDRSAPEAITVNYALAPVVNTLKQRAITLAGSRDVGSSIWVNGNLLVAAGNSSWSTSYNLVEGDSTLSVTARDQAGNESTPISMLFNVDSVKPTVSSVLPSGSVNQQPNAITIAANDNGSGLSLSGSSVIVTRNNVSVAGQLTLTGNTYSFVPAGSFLEGSYQVAVQLADQRGNISNLQLFSFSLDLTPPPAPVINAFPAVTSVNQYQFTGVRQANTAILLNGNQVIASSSATAWSYTANLVEGDNTLKFSAKDLAGNVSTETTATIRFDNTAPGMVPLTVNVNGSGTTVGLNWAAYNEFVNGNDIDTYLIYIQSTPFADISFLTPKFNVPASTKNFELTNLERATEFYVAVVAQDKSGLKLTNVLAQAATPKDIQAPDDISSLAVVSGANSLALQWLPSLNSAADLASYQVSINDAVAGLRTVTINLADLADPAAAVVFNVTDLQAASANQIKVVAVDNDGNQSVGLTNPGVTWLVNPQPLSADAISGQIKYLWPANSVFSSVKHYALYVETSNFGDVSGLTPKLTVAKGSAGASTVQAALAGLSNGTEYFAAVVTVNASNGFSPFVVTTSATPADDTEGPIISAVNYRQNATLLNLAAAPTITAAGDWEVTASDTGGVARIEFYIDGQAQGSVFTASSGVYKKAINPQQLSEGNHTFTVIAVDSWDNKTTQDFVVDLALAAPPVPSLTKPASYLLTNEPLLQIAGTSVVGAEVQVFNNGVAVGNKETIDSQGKFIGQLTLSEGDNLLTLVANYQGRVATSAASAPRSVRLDSKLPNAPIGLTATAADAGQVHLSWSKVVNNDSLNQVVGYNLYRATQDFSVVSDVGVVKINSQLITGTTRTDMPASDDQYVYRASTVNQAGTESALSSAATVTVDSTPPKAISVSYESAGKVDEATGRFAPGLVAIEVEFSEPLRNKPYFALVPNGGVPLVVTLTKSFSDERLYSGQLTIETSTPSGIAYTVLSAHDVAGNRGSQVEQGAQLLIDTQGPDVALLALNPGEPLKVDAQDGLLVAIALHLKDDTGNGQMPLLIPTLDGQVIEAYAAGVSLTKAAESELGAPIWQGDITLPNSAGLDEFGSPLVQTLSFLYSAQDDLQNVSEKIQGDYRFQVYQGDLPPLDVPTNLQATAQPDGKVALDWKPVAGAASYAVYRKQKGVGEFSLLEEVTLPSAQDLPDADHTYLYAVASVRAENEQRAESAQSAPVEVNADRVAPAAPSNFSLELNGAGIVARWLAPTTDALGQQENLSELRYQLYRLPLAEGESADAAYLEGQSPLQQGIPELIALDKTPNELEHSYLVTAVDKAGNESVPSATVYLNFDLLPVNQLQVRLADQGFPQLSWQHAGASIESFDVFEGADDALVALNTSPVIHVGNPAGFTDAAYNGGQASRGANMDRRYSVTALDNTGASSLASSILLPALSTQLTLGQDGQEQQLQRGVMNTVNYRVLNKGHTEAQAVRLIATVNDKGSLREHQSELFGIAPGGFADVSLVIGGFANLEGYAAVDLRLEQTPQPGQAVIIEQTTDMVVTDASLFTSLETDTFIRGGVGRARFVIENTSSVETEILLARDNGNQSSNEVRFSLLDSNENVLSTFPVTQITGGVVSISGGQVVARIAPGETFTSAWFDIPVPEAAPDLVNLVLDIDKYRYHTGRTTAVIIEGSGTRQSVSLTETEYLGAVTLVSPALSFGGQEAITVQGQARNRETGLANPNVPLSLVFSVDGFEKTAYVSTDIDGNFSYQFAPQGVAGRYSVTALHPDSLSREAQAEFVVQTGKVTPSQVTVQVPRNYQQKVPVKVVAGKATPLTQVQLVAVPAPGETELAIPAGIAQQFATPISIAPEKTGYVNLYFSGDNSAPENGEMYFEVRANTDVSNQQVLGSVRVNYTLAESRPALAAKPAFVETGVGLAKTVTETFTLTNKGLDVLQNGSLVLQNAQGGAAPSWGFISSPTQIGDLAVGQSTQVELTFKPTASVPQDNYEFRIIVQSDNAPDFTVQAFATVVSSEVGNAFFHAADIYTATLDNNNEPIPGLAGTKIELQNELLLNLKYTLSTNAQGEALFSNLPAGRYSYRASAFDHDSVSGRVWVKPGLTQTEDVFLMNRLVTVEWDVREITLEDRYEITLSAVFETNVPVAVVMLDPLSINLPTMRKGDIFYGELSVTNYGLIRADNVKTSLPSGNDYVRFEFLNEVPEALAAGEVFFIPYRIHAQKDFDPDADADTSGGGSCGFSAAAQVTYESKCANGSQVPGGTGTQWHYSNSTSCGSSGGGGGGGPSYTYYPRHPGTGGGFRAPGGVAVGGEEQACVAPPLCPTCNESRNKN
ncbi:Ig-like domain-containing protein [Simiduia curdlanivorans]|uniref:Ig-like domain-containing protein n=6 Tax=Simiduia curdlanivorans TaxID=1492769 RepID=A0ABV8V2K9_9GAMM